MNNKFAITDMLQEQGMLPLYFHADKNVASKILQSLYRAGVRIVEFTNRGAEALNNFSALKRLRDAEMPDLFLGAGTIKTKQEAADYISAGTDFIISPGLNEDVCTIANQANIFWIPGCMTPSEIMHAERCGASVIKLFPGNTLGPAFVSAVRDVFPALKFIPTGGVSLDAESLSKWFASGVVAIGAGSTLIKKQVIDAGDYLSIETAARNALNLVSGSR